MSTLQDILTEVPGQTEEILKASRNIKESPTKKSRIRLTSDFSTENQKHNN